MKLVHREILLAKIETIYGTDAAPTAAANAVLVENLSWAQAGLRIENRPAVRPSQAPLQAIYGGRLREVTFDVELKGSGVAGTAPEYDVLLQACGLAATIVASTSVTYTPISTPSAQASCTLYYYEDGSLVKLTGCRGTCTLTLKAGMAGKIKFQMHGHVSSIADVGLPTPTFSTIVPPACLNLPVTLGAYSPVLETFEVGLNNKIEMVPTVGATDGYGPIIISARDVKGMMDPQADTVANFPAEADLAAGTQLAFASGTLGTLAGNKMAINMPAIYIHGIKPGARNGVRVYTLDYGAVESGGTDNEISIAYT